MGCFCACLQGTFCALSRRPARRSDGSGTATAAGAGVGDGGALRRVDPLDQKKIKKIQKKYENPLDN